MLIPLEKLVEKYSINADFVLHIGAHTGEEREEYQNAGIKKTIWVEANPKVYQKLKLHLEKFGGHYICFKACISDTDNKLVNFAITNNDSQSSSILELGTHRQAHPEVHVVKNMPLLTTRIDTLFERNNLRLEGAGFLNIDLQGAELLALRGMGKLIDHFQWAYIEVNKEELYKGCPMIEDIDEYFAAFDFERMETKWCGNTGWGDAFYLKKQ